MPVSRYQKVLTSAFKPWSFVRRDATLRGTNGSEVSTATRQLPVRLSEEQFRAVNAIAETDGVSMAEEIRQAIEACRGDEAFQARLQSNIERSQQVFHHRQAR